MKQSLSTTSSKTRNSLLFQRASQQIQNIDLLLKIQSKNQLTKRSKIISQNVRPFHRNQKQRTIFVQLNNKEVNSHRNSLKNSVLNESSLLISQLPSMSQKRNYLKEEIKNNQNKKQYLIKARSGYQFTFNNEFFQNQDQKREADFNVYQNMTISDSFLGSFKAVFTSYIQLYFQQMTLSLMIRRHKIQIFHQLLQSISQEYFLFKDQLKLDELSMAMYGLIKKNNSAYKMSDVKNCTKRIFHKNQKINVNSFQKLFAINQNLLYLTNPSQNFMDKSIKQLSIIFFEICIQFSDTEIKLKKICKAHEKKTINLLLKFSIVEDQIFKRLAQFLYFDAQKSRKWLILRFQQYAKQQFGPNNFLINLLKWIKTTN